MKTPSLRWIAFGVFALLMTGCGHLDLDATSDPNRVLQGNVNAGALLPAGAEVVVRLIVTGGATAMRPTAGEPSLPTRASVTMDVTEQVLGEDRRILANATTQPVPFRIEYRADDAVLRRGVNLDVRISVEGKLRYRTINAQAVTLASAPYPQEVAVQAVQ